MSGETQSADDMIERLRAAGADVDNTIYRLSGNTGFYTRLIGLFPSDPTMSALREAVAVRDNKAAESAVHTLKGVCGNIGLTPLYTACCAMLGELRGGRANRAFELFDEVEMRYAEAVVAITG